MIDEAFEKYGYKLAEESKYGAYYIRHDEKYSFDQVVCILHKASGKHIIQSYEKGTDRLCGVEIPVLLLLWLKGQKLKIKYRWR